MAEEAAKRGDSRAVHKITNGIIGKRSNLNWPVKDENSKMVTAPDEISEFWAVYFEKVFNRPSPPNTADIPTTHCRALGSDKISAEMIKISSGACITVWIAFFACIWKSVKMPKEWRRSTIIKLFKKENALNCDNWRGVSPFFITGKLFSQIIFSYIHKALKKYLRDEKWGLPPSCSCSDLIHFLQMLIEECNEWRQKIDLVLHLVFVDFKKAFDSIHWELLWKIFRHDGIVDKLVSLIIALYENTECFARTHEGNTRYFSIMAGVKHGCILFLFRIAFFACIWKSVKMPEEWRRSTIIKLFKKEDALNCDNWRGVSFFFITGKLFSQIILRCIRKALNKHLRDKNLASPHLAPAQTLYISCTCWLRNATNGGKRPCLCGFQKTLSLWISKNPFALNTPRVTGWKSSNTTAF